MAREKATISMNNNRDRLQSEVQRLEELNREMVNARAQLRWANRLVSLAKKKNPDVLPKAVAKQKEAEGNYKQLSDKIGAQSQVVTDLAKEAQKVKSQPTQIRPLSSNNDSNAQRIQAKPIPVTTNATQQQSKQTAASQPKPPLEKATIPAGSSRVDAEMRYLAELNQELNAAKEQADRARSFRTTMQESNRTILPRTEAQLQKFEENHNELLMKVEQQYQLALKLIKEEQQKAQEVKSQPTQTQPQPEQAAASQPTQVQQQSKQVIANQPKVTFFDNIVSRVVNAFFGKKSAVGNILSTLITLFDRFVSGKKPGLSVVGMESKQAVVGMEPKQAATVSGGNAEDPLVQVVIDAKATQTELREGMQNSEKAIQSFRLGEEHEEMTDEAAAKGLEELISKSENSSQTTSVEKNRSTQGGSNLLTAAVNSDDKAQSESAAATKPADEPEAKTASISYKN